MLKKSKLKEYLEKLYGKKVKLISAGGLSELTKDELKGFGYGNPFLIEYEISEGRKKAVLQTMRAEGFGHEHMADRAAVLLLAHSTFDRLPKHIKSLDVGALSKGDSLVSLGDAEEFFLLDEFVEGKEYFHDLERIKEEKRLGEKDLKRVKALSGYLVQIHKKKKDNPSLYVRRIRELVGHGECIMGLIDSYPTSWEFAGPNYFKRVEEKCVTWRWKLRGKENRLSQVHGDYHPWNILFKDEKGTSFWVLDRSRGEWGEPADDATAMSINYLFYSLQKYGKLTSPFEELYLKFMNNYIEGTGDLELLSVCQLFYAWRALVIASPIWYPNLSSSVRRSLLKFIENVLEEEKFDILNVNSYFS